MLDGSRDQITGVPPNVIAAIKPSKAGESVMGSSLRSLLPWRRRLIFLTSPVIGGEHRGQTYKTVSRDGNDWMLEIPGGHTVLEDGVLGLKG